MKVLITGTSRGIGNAVANYLISQKETTVELLCISRSKTELNLSTKNPNSNVYFLEADVSSETDKITKFVSNNLKWKTIDILFHNAGYLKNVAFDNTEHRDLEESFRVNTFAPYLLTQSLLPLLRESSSAHIVCTSSMGGVEGSVKFPGLSAYSMSKAAVHSFVQCLAEEFKDTSLRFNAIALGAVQTVMLSNAFPGYEAKMTPDKIAPFIGEFLLIGHKYMNGKILPLSSSTP